MNIDNLMHCQGLESKDRMDWDGTYPKYEATRTGIVVHLNKRSKMPGIFTDEGRARMAYNRYLGAIAEVDSKKGK